jgi:predicted nuclease of predicted toxin-antitoxin system
MSLSIVVDMNLSPTWVAALTAAGFSVVHWSTIGAATATDAYIMAWARSNRHIVLTHDLDFGTALALTHASGPSIIQVRTNDILPADIASLVIDVIRKHERELSQGALLVIEETRQRIRILPL